MKKYFLITALFFLSAAKSTAYSNDFSLKHSLSASVTEYETNVTFPAGYAVGDYIEFLKVSPINAGASGYYQISISYTRNNVASAATHLAAISHSNPAVWRETGRINNNPYFGTGVNVTVDCNTEYANPRFRIRAINTLGTTTQPLMVNIKVTSLNITSTYTALNNTGSDLTVSKFLPMTSDWDLYVGDVHSANGASLAIKAIQNGNVGIGTTNPKFKLEVSSGAKIKTTTIGATMMSAENGWIRDGWLTGCYGPAVWDQTISKWVRPSETYNDIGGIVFQDEGTYFIFDKAGTQLEYTNTEFLNKAYMYANILNGNVGIGTITPDTKLTVNGTVHAKEVRVDMLGALVPDYVFANDYKLKSLQEVEAYIKANSHLPEIPSAQEIEKKGLMLAEMNMSLLKKIEELTLYAIEQQKQNKEQQEQINQLTNQNKKIEQLEKDFASLRDSLTFEKDKKNEK